MIRFHPNCHGMAGSQYFCGITKRSYYNKDIYNVFNAVDRQGHPGLIWDSLLWWTVFELDVSGLGEQGINCLK